MSQRDGLHQNISEGGAFRRPGQNGNFHGVRVELVERCRLTAAANDLQFFNFFTRELFEFPQRDPEKKGRAFVDAADIRGMAGGNRLTGFGAELGVFLPAYFRDSKTVNHQD